MKSAQETSKVLRMQHNITISRPVFVRCANCETENKDVYSHCVNCGDALHEECPYCHKQKPRIEPKCGFCGKDPTVARKMIEYTSILERKAYWLLLGCIILLLSFWFVLLMQGIVSFLLTICATLGIIAVGYEAYEEVKWQDTSRFWKARLGWEDNESIFSRIKNSYYIFWGILMAAAVQLVITLLLVFA